ncbi:MAG: response regulator [Proteobacteria bacterium]|nr:response regulator [Pseudomonadota bacterium]
MNLLCGVAADGLPCGLIVLDADGVMIWQNAEAQSILGEPGQDSLAMGRNVAELPNVDDAGLLPILKQVLDGRELRNVVADLTTLRGKRVSLSVNAGPIDDEAGVRQGVWLAIQDLGEDGALAGRLLSAQRMEFIGVATTGVIHDLNNLLTALGGTLELLRSGAEADPILLGALDGMIRRSTDVTRQLLRAARPEAERFEPLDLNTPVRQAADLLRHSFGKEIRVTLDVPGAAVAVVGDRTALLQAMFNLGVNARDAMGGRGQLFLELAVVADIEFNRSQDWVGRYHARLRVSDDGPGIPPEVRDRLFEPFFSTKSPDRGTGMGLAVVHRAVTDHGGLITIGDLPDRGAVFEILLPMYPGPVDNDEPTKALSVPSYIFDLNRPPLKDKRILVTDDEASLRLLLDTALTGRGATVETVANGRHAVEVIREAMEAGRRFHGAVVDLRMPGGDGTEAIPLMREADPRLKIIATSGLPPTEAEAEDLSKDKAKFVGKPFQLSEIIDLLVLS